MNDTKELEIITNFVDAINKHDIDEMVTLLAKEFIYIDSSGEQFEGIEENCKNWNEYFRYIPDYSLDVDDYFQKEDLIVLVGSASGTYCPGSEYLEENSWKVPKAWKAIVKDSKLVYWQIFADNSKLMRIIKRYPGKGLDRPMSIFAKG